VALAESEGMCEKEIVMTTQPAESPTLSTGCKAGSHRIQGISDEFIPAIVQSKDLNEVISIHDGNSILMAQKLANTLGLAVGISSECNFLAGGARAGNGGSRRGGGDGLL
jgi:cysteine synthase A